MPQGEVGLEILRNKKNFFFFFFLFFHFRASQTLAAQVWSLWTRPIILLMALGVEALLHKLPLPALNNNLPSSWRRSPSQNRHH